MSSTFDASERNFKSSLKNEIGALQQTLSSMAEQGRTNNEYAEEEAAFVGQVEKTKEAANKQCDEIRGEIMKKRPNPNASQSEKDAYRELLRLSAEGMLTLRAWLTDIFARIMGVVRQIVTWVWNGVVNVASSIASAFAGVIGLFF